MKHNLFSIALAAAFTALHALPLAAADEPAPDSPEWGQREISNYAITGQGPMGQASNPAFMQQLEAQSAANRAAFFARQQADPAWNSWGNLCHGWDQQCAGDPFRYPDAPGPRGTGWYGVVGDVTPVTFYDRDGARLSGRIWKPAASYAGEHCTLGQGNSVVPMPAFPGAVIINGSVQAPEPLYWWAAQALVESCYMVMTFDPRGQGRSDFQAPDGQQGSNANPIVFETGLVDAIEFFFATDERAYPHTGAVPTDSANPYAAHLDRDRFAILGHSLGARGVSSVQGYGAPGALTWTQAGGGAVLDANPVDVAVAWDNLTDPASADSGGGPPEGFPGAEQYQEYNEQYGPQGLSPVVPRVPTMGQSADYYLTPTPFTQPPDRLEKTRGFLAWQAAGVPAYQLVIRGGTHYEWSLIPSFPTSAWGLDPATGQMTDSLGWGNPLAKHYSIAWLDYWLKLPREPGSQDALERLLNDQQFCERLSFYFTSARSFPNRAPGNGPAAAVQHENADIRSSCIAR